MKSIFNNFGSKVFKFFGRPGIESNATKKSAKNLDERILLAFQNKLNRPEFIEVNSRKFVSDRYMPVRQIIEFQPLKGNTYSFLWGFSVDFVPLFRNGKFKWKRTNKSCEMDLCIDPIDDSGDVPTWCSFSNSPGYQEASVKEIEKVLAKCLPISFAIFDKVNTAHDLIDLFQQRSVMKFARFSLDAYVQTDLAWGLLLYSVGEHSKADVHMSKFIRGVKVNADDPILVSAIELAKKSFSSH